MKIDFGVFLNKNDSILIGRERGLKFKNNIEGKYGYFEELEKKDENIEISIPENILSINKSFFLGVFELPIRRLENRFLEKYQFLANPYVLKKIKEHVSFLLSYSGKHWDEFK